MDRSGAGATEDQTLVTVEDSSSSSSSSHAALQIQHFLVLTFHYIFKNSGTLKQISDRAAAKRIKRLVELAQERMTILNDRIPRLDMYESVAKSVAKELQRTFVEKTAHMLLLPEPSVENNIIDCIRRHVAIELQRKPTWFRCECFSTNLLLECLALSVIVVLCLILSPVVRF